MLKSLYIKNFALIKELEIEFCSGLNIITGETGAGKSIIVDALMLLLGYRASTNYIRHGEKKAVIEGIFSLPESHQLLNKIESSGCDFDDNDNLIIRREISEKKSRSFFNDSPIQVAALKKIGDFLVDFHGQHDHQLLLNNENHLKFIDIIASNGKLLADYTQNYLELHKKIKLYNDLINKKDSLDKRIDFIQFELNEINKLAPAMNEDDELEVELKIKENSELLFQTSSELFNILYNEDNSVFNELTKAQNLIKKLSLVDDKFSQFSTDLDAALITIEETSNFAGNYKDNIEFDSERIESIRERLLALRGLSKKYGNLSKTLDKHKQLSDELELIDNFDDEIKIANKKILNEKNNLTKAAIKLSTSRKKVSKILESSIEKHLKQLGIAYSIFNVKNEYKEISNLLNPKSTYNQSSIIVNNKEVETSETGIDRIEFHISTNKGELPKPLANIASGGEISRVMLAIKSLLAESDELPMLVFDEIDSGISGKIAQKVGLAMKELALKHQIISITHLPQICALATRNILVEKNESQGRTIISAHQLNNTEKLQETARLISGEDISPAALKSAVELANAGKK